MCLICVEFSRQRLTVQEAERNNTEVNADAPEHRHAVQEALDLSTPPEDFEEMVRFVEAVEPLLRRMSEEIRPRGVMK